MIRLLLTLVFLNFACQIAALPTLGRGEWLLLGLCLITAVLSLMHLLIDPPEALRRFRL